MSLDPKRKRRIRRKAWAEARAEHGAQLASLRGEKKAARHAYHSEVKSTRGAVDYLQNALGSAIENAKESGLRGKYLQQVVSELRARLADSANIVPMAKQSGRVELRDTLASLNDQILSQQVSQQNSARDAITAALKAARSRQAARVEAKHENRRDRTRMVKNTKIAMLNTLDEVKQAALTSVPAPPDDASGSDMESYQKAVAQKQTAIMFLNDLRQGKEKAIRHLATEVAGADGGGDLFEAMAMVRRLLDSRAVGKLTNPFNVFPVG